MYLKRKCILHQPASHTVLFNYRTNLCKMLRNANEVMNAQQQEQKQWQLYNDGCSMSNLYLQRNNIIRPDQTKSEFHNPAAIEKVHDEIVDHTMIYQMRL